MATLTTHILDVTDLDTQALLLQLELEDLRAFGQGVESTGVSDGDVAVRLAIEEITTALGRVEAHRHAQAMIPGCEPPAGAQPEILLPPAGPVYIAPLAQHGTARNFEPAPVPLVVLPDRAIVLNNIASVQSANPTHTARTSFIEVVEAASTQHLASPDVFPQGFHPVVAGSTQPNASTIIATPNLELVFEFQEEDLITLSEDNDKSDGGSETAVGGFDKSKSEASESEDESLVTSTPNAEEVNLIECTLCLDQMPSPSMIRLQCGDHYCTGCLCELFENSFKQELDFPTRCCEGPIEITAVAQYLTPDIHRNYNDKTVEFGTEYEKRTYCRRTGCGAFLTLATLVREDVVKCVVPGCETETCTVCKGDVHLGECPEDVGARGVASLAESEGWKRCPRCRQTIEFLTGCNHMKCGNCGHDFCWQCLMPIIPKTCPCPHADARLLVAPEVRLHARREFTPEERAQAQRYLAAANPGDGMNEDAIVRRMAVERGHADCIGHYYHQTPGNHHRCDSCLGIARRQIHVCEECDIRQCQACRD